MTFDDSGFDVGVAGPWQMAATGLPLWANWRTKATAGLFMRRWSGFITPPGRTRASYCSGLTSLTRG